MPVLVIGADTSLGSTLMKTLSTRDGEVRAFVSDAIAGIGLKKLGVKVAVGDVSDASHVGAAATGCFSVVAISEAAIDDRERAFASTAHDLVEAWSEAIADASPQRVIWVQYPNTPGPRLQAPEVLVVAADGIDLHELAERVAIAEDAASL